MSKRLPTWPLMAVFALVGCATPVPPSNFQLARDAVARGDFIEAGQRFRLFADAELEKLDAGANIGRANKTALAYRDAAKNFLLGGNREEALAALERCVSQLARHAEGELCIPLLREAQLPADRVERRSAAVAPFDSVRDARRQDVAAQQQAQRDEAERQRRELEARAPLREWQAERDRVEGNLAFARASEAMLLSMRKDTSQIRLQRQMLERRLEQLDASRPTVRPVSNAGASPSMPTTAAGATGATASAVATGVTVAAPSALNATTVASTAATGVTKTMTDEVDEYGTLTTKDGDPRLLRAPTECLAVRLAPMEGGWSVGQPREIIRISNTCSFRIQYVGCLEAQSKTSSAKYSCSNTPSRVEDPDMRDLIVGSLGPGEAQQVQMSDGTDPNLFSSGSFAVCREAELGAPYVIRMVRVNRNTSGAWTASCDYESRETPKAGRPTSGGIVRSPWEKKPTPNPRAERVQLLSCPELTRWYRTLRRHETPAHSVGKWDECSDPGEAYTASYQCVHRSSASVADTKATLDLLAKDLTTCLRDLPDAQKVLVDEMLGGDTGRSFGQAFTAQYGNQWQTVYFHIFLKEADGGSEIVITGANYSRDFDPRNPPR
jgi:hypothetical protein